MQHGTQSARAAGRVMLSLLSLFPSMLFFDMSGNMSTGAAAAAMAAAMAERVRRPERWQPPAESSEARHPSQRWRAHGLVEAPAGGRRGMGQNWACRPDSVAWVPAWLPVQSPLRGRLTPAGRSHAACLSHRPSRPFCTQVSRRSSMPQCSADGRADRQVRCDLPIVRARTVCTPCAHRVRCAGTCC